MPISAISDWYDYYRANGMVRAPHSSSNPTGNNNAFQGEDLDVLADVVYSRIDETGQRTICQPVIDYLETTSGSRDRQPQRVLAGAQLHEGRRERPRRDPARPRQQRLQRHDQERGAVLRRAQEAGRAAHVLLPPGRPRRRAAGRARQLLVHPLPVRRQRTASRTCRARGSCARRRPARRARRR